MKIQGEHRDLILQVMLAIASADERLVASESETICRIYLRLTGKSIDAVDLAQAIEASSLTPDNLADALASQCDGLDAETKETLIRAAYMVLMADRRVSARERKKLHDFADALQIPEFHLTALLEDLSSLED